MWIDAPPNNVTEEDVAKAVDLLLSAYTLEQYLDVFDDQDYDFWAGCSRAVWADQLPDKALTEAEHDVLIDSDLDGLKALPRDVLLEAGRSTLKELILEAANEIYFGNRRDMTSMYVRCSCGCGHTTELYLSAAMSWGDEPDAFRPMRVLDRFDVASVLNKSDLQHLATAAE
jgi:hypothetical protein